MQRFVNFKIGRYSIFSTVSSHVKQILGQMVRHACMLVADNVTGNNSNSDEHDGCKLSAWHGPGSRVALGILFAVARRGHRIT